MKKARFIFINTIILAAALAVLLSLSLLLAFDGDKEYFRSDSILPSLFRAGFFISCIYVAIAGSAIFQKGKIIASDTEISGGQRLIANLFGIFSVAYGLLTLFLFTSKGDAFEAMSALGALMLGAYILLLANGGGFKSSAPKLICLFATILLPIGITFGNSQNYFRPVNNTINNLSAVFCIFFLIYILNEGKSLFYGNHQRSHFASILLLILSSLPFSVAYVLAFAFGKASEKGVFRFSLLLLALSICLVSRANHFALTCEEIDEPAEETEEQSDEAKEIEETTENTEE